MVKCWFLFSDNLSKPREPNYFEPTNETKTDNNESNSNDIKKISWSTLSQFGIQYWFIECDKMKITNKLEMIKTYQNCPNSDAVIFNDKHTDIQNYAEFGFKRLSQYNILYICVFEWITYIYLRTYILICFVLIVIFMIKMR